MRSFNLGNYKERLVKVYIRAQLDRASVILQ